MAGHAQIAFQKTFGDSGNFGGYSVWQTFDGGYVFTGIKVSAGTSESDIVLIRTNDSGDTLWTRIFSGANSEYPYAVRQTADSGFVVIGSTNSFGTGNHDILLVKTNASGNLLWTKAYGSAGIDVGFSIGQTTDGGFILTGTYDSGNGSVIFLIKTDSGGNPVWTQFFQGLNGTAVQQTTDGGYVLLGRTFGDISLIKTDPAGNMIWRKIYGGSYDDKAHSVEQTIDGGYIVGGNIYQANFGVHYVYLIKTDAMGDTLWTKAYSSNGDYSAVSLTETYDGGYISTGYIDTTFTFFRHVHGLKTDSTGIPQWSKIYGGQNYSTGFNIRKTTDGGCVITGSHVGSSGGSSIYLIKTDSVGNSGCNESNLITTVIDYSTQISYLGNVINSVAIPVNSAPLLVEEGCIISTLCTNVGMQDVLTEPLQSIVIYPNPSNGDFTLTFSRPVSHGRVEVFNVCGQRVFEMDVYNKSMEEIFLEYVHDGIYFVKMFDGINMNCMKLTVVHD